MRFLGVIISIFRPVVQIAFKYAILRAFIFQHIRTIVQNRIFYAILSGFKISCWCSGLLRSSQQLEFRAYLYRYTDSRILSEPQALAFCCVSERQIKSEVFLFAVAMYKRLAVSEMTCCCSVTFFFAQAAGLLLSVLKQKVNKEFKKIYHFLPQGQTLAPAIFSPCAPC